MTLVHIDVEQFADGPHEQVAGSVTATASRVLIVGPAFVLPAPVTIGYNRAAIDVELAELPAGYAWFVRIEGAGMVLHRCVYPTGAGPVNLTDLANLDPATLDPEADPEAAWWALLDDRVPPSGTTGFVLTKGAGGVNSWTPGGGGGGTGDVVGPASSNDNRVVRMDGTTGKLIQQSPVTIDDAGAITGMTTVDGRDVSVDGAALDSHVANTSNPHSTTKTQVGLANVDNVQQQPLDADLTTIAGLTPTTDNVIQSVAGSWASRTMAQLKTALGLVKGDVGLGNVDNVQQQPIDSDLTTIAGLTATTNNIIQSVGSAWASRTPTQVKAALVIAESDVTNLVTDLAAKKTDSMATDKILGRDTAGTGAIEELGLVGATISGGNLVVTAGGSGDVVGPASSIDNEIVRFDSTTGKLIQGSATPVTISDAGSISVPASQTVDGRDVSVDGTKLDGVEALADVTDAANVTAAGAVMDGDFSTDGLMARTAAGVYASRTIAGTTNRVTVSNGDGDAGNPTLDVGTDVYAAGGTDVPVADGGTGRSTATTAYGLIAAGTTAAGVQQTVSPGTSGHLLKSAGGSALPAFSAGAPADVALGNVDNTSDATKNAATVTLTNKRITKRVFSTADTATLTIASDDYDGAKVTALAQAMTIAAPTGTPTAMQPLIIRILDNGTARALTWDAAFRAIGVTLPTTTVISKTVYVGVMWNSDASKWDAIAVATQA
jgi:hypothetical protein